MKVVILCGGMGTRLREETEFRPKPMVEVGDRPILWHIMRLYAHYGHTDFVLCLGYKGQVIREYFLHYAAMASDVTLQLTPGAPIVHHDVGEEERWTITLADTGLTTPKGGRLKQVQRYIGNERFFLTYGDGLADVDIPKLIAFHERHGSVATFTGVRPQSRFATVQLDEGGTVRSWKEKQVMEEFINGGFFVFEPAIFSYLTDDCELEEEPMETLAVEGQVAMYPHHGFWHCMDTYRDMEILNRLWSDGGGPWAVWQRS